ncbi:MAG: slipin family protein [Bacteroidales bacterium]|nr:slipin family protein [Bacteroidales bacterium]
MKLFKPKKKYQVKPNTIGYFYRENKFEKILEPGIYEIKDPKDKTELFVLPLAGKMLNIGNQEVLSKDNIAFRFSFYFIYKITDGMKLLSNFTLNNGVYQVITEAEQLLYNAIQIKIRDKISQFNSDELNEKRSELTDQNSDEIKKLAEPLGIEIEQVVLKDLTFPKNIQTLFSKQLESKIRAKSELENARTVVATARALKNATEIMKDNDDMKFLQFLETINKIAEKGRHTFMIGDVNGMQKK